MITADQIVAHAVGDYIFQSDWMANEKTERTWPAVVHAVTYTLPFLAFRPSPAALTMISGSHFVIDRWRLARHVIFIRNHLAPRRVWRSWPESRATGFPPERPMWLAFWLMIIADNVLHVVINGIALRYPRRQE
jgi:hypothetical protein